MVGFCLEKGWEGLGRYWEREVGDGRYWSKKKEVEEEIEEEEEEDEEEQKSATSQSLNKLLRELP